MTRAWLFLGWMGCPKSEEPPPGGDLPGGCAEIPLASELVDGGTWDPSFTVAGFAGHDGLGPGVYDLAREPDGGIVAVGRFQYVGQRHVDGMARLGDAGWDDDPRLAVLDAAGLSAVAVNGDGRLAVATYATLPFDLLARDGEIRVDEGAGLDVVARFHGAVRAMVWFDEELWVAGVFALDGGPAAPGLARLTDHGWAAPPGGPVEGLGVYELTVDGDTLLIGGSFSEVGGIAASNVASWDGTAWTALDLPDATVLALARDAEGTLFAGGLMSVEGSVAVGGIAQRGASGWETVGGGLANPTFRGVVSDLVLHQGEIHVGGCFSAAGDTPATNFARWTGTGWEALAGPDGVGTAWFSPLACGDEGPAAIWDAGIQRLLDDGDRLYVGGFFPGVDGVPSQSVIAYHDGEWEPQGDGGQGFSGGVRSLAVGGPGCAVHAMGGVTHAGSLPVDGRVLKQDGGGWVPVSPPVPSDRWCGALAIDDAGIPSIGCDDGGVYTASGDTWEDRELPGDEGTAVLAFDAQGTLWAAGGGVSGFVSADAGQGFRSIGTFDGRVSALAFGPRGEVVAGGTFTRVDDVRARGVARWDGTAWVPLGEGVAGTVLAVARSEDGVIYASTADDGTVDRLVLGRWDGQRWAEVATPEPGPTGAGYQLYALLARGPYVIAAGFGWPASDERNVFVYDGTTFQSLRGGIPAISVDTAVLAADGLWFGGAIAEAGPPDGRISSVGVAHLR